VIIFIAVTSVKKEREHIQRVNDMLMINFNKTVNKTQINEEEANESRSRLDLSLNWIRRPPRKGREIPDSSPRGNIFRNKIFFKF